jgi:hypothetical protein
MLALVSLTLASLPTACVRDPETSSSPGPEPPVGGPTCCAHSPPDLTGFPGPPPTIGGGPDEPEEDCLRAAALSINEVSSTNREIVRDDLDDSPDWMEIYNGDTVTVDLAGWTLSDDPDDPGRWTLPAVALAPEQHLLVYASGQDRATVAATWDTRVDQGDTWRYLAATSPPPPSWFDPTLDDSGWDIGPSGFGSGDQDDATEVSTDTVYARTTFELAADEVADLTALLLHVDYDDAFVAYLNGVEVARANIGVPGIPPTWDQYANQPHEALLPQGLPPERFDLTDGALALLVAGTNTLALEAHDTSATSSDLSLVPFLTLGFGTERPARSSTALPPLRAVLHTSFSVDADGEVLALHDPAGCEADVLRPGKMYTDQSFGRQPDGTDVVGYFMAPTPGAPNTTESRPGFAAEPAFAPPPGHHAGGAEVTVTAGPLADVRVAWGGAEPTEDGALYTGPLATGVSGEAVVLRARAWEDGLWPSPIATATYLLRDPGELPIVSLATDPPNLWDAETGIYVFGDEYDDEYPYYGANFHEDWERPVHAEAWEPDGALGFAVDAGIEIYGGTTRAHGQKSLLLKLRSGYGDDAIEHEVFPGLGLTTFERLVLRASGNDWHGCDQDGCAEGALLRDGLMHRLAGAAGVDVMAYRPAEVYLNGEYWGIYNLREQAEETWVAAHHGHEDIDLLQSDSKVVVGDAYAYFEMLDLLRSRDLSDPVEHALIEAAIDVEELVAYLAFEVFYANTDWPGNNIKYWRPRTPDGQWRWLMFDTDFGLGRWGRSPSNDSLAAALSPDGVSWPNPAWSTELFRLLTESPTFATIFVNSYADYMNTLLAPEVTVPELHEVADGIAATLPRQLDRWGSWDDGVVSYSLGSGVWAEEIDWIEEWLVERPAHARDHVVQQFGLAGTWTLQLDVEPAGAGTFELTAVAVDAPFEGVYFQGVPVTLTAVPAFGYTFDGWSDPDLSADPTVVLDPDGPVGPVSLVARFR